MMLSKRSVVAISIICLAIALAVAYYFFDPVEVSWMPRCIWKVATGTDCPGCGSQRMAHSLMHGDFNGAWHANAYALCMIPLIGFLIWLEFIREKYPGLYRRVHSPFVIWTLVVSVFAWWILRNLI